MLYRPNALPPLAAVYTGLAALKAQDSVVFGGSLYGTDMGRPINDIDLVISRPLSMTPVQAASVFAQSLQAKMTPVGEYGHRFMITPPSGPEIDLNITNRVDAVMRAHSASVGLAGIAFSTQQQTVFIGSNYLSDKTNRQLSLLDPDQLDFAHKLQRKYPDFPIVTPSGRRVLHPALSAAS